MDIGVVIVKIQSRFGDPFFLKIPQGMGAFGGKGKTPQSIAIGQVVESINQGDGKESAEDAHQGSLDIDLVPRRLPLGDDDALVAENGKDICIELRAKERCRRTDGIGGVDQDDIKLLFRLFDEGDTVADDQFKPFITTVQNGCRLRYVSPASFDDHSIDLHHGTTLYAPMPQHLPRRAPVASADDQDTAGIGMYEEGDVDDHIVVDELVSLAHHHQTIVEEHLAVEGAFDDIDALKGAPIREQRPLNPKRRLHIILCLLCHP